MAILDNTTSSLLIPTSELISALAFVLGIAYVLRPIILWMLNRIEQGKSLMESYIVTIFLFVLLCGFISELVSQHYLLGPLLLGHAVPEGVPLRAALVTKVEKMATGIFYPTYLANSGLKTNIIGFILGLCGLCGWLLLF